MNNEKISKKEINYYLNSKPSYEDIKNMLKDKIDTKEFNNKYDELLQNFEIFKKEINEKYVTKDDMKNSQKNLENKENNDFIEIKNLLDKKADKESVYDSLKLKSDKNEIDTILGNKLDKSDLSLIIKALDQKLNKEEFNKYISNENNPLNNNNLLNELKGIKADVQEMKKNMNKRIDIINTDIERFTEKVKNKFESMNIAINTINKRVNETESYKNILNLLKNKLDIEKFDSAVKKIKTNLEKNFIDISKNNDIKIKQLIDDNIKIINQNCYDILEKQNNLINNYIQENKNELSQYQIQVQGIINKLDEENKIEIKNLKNEFIEKIDEKLVTDKFYNLSEETKNKNNINININQISIEKNKLNKNNTITSLLNSNDKDINEYKPQLSDFDSNKLDKNLQKESRTKEKIEIKEMYKVIEDIKNEIKNNKNEFTNAMSNQSIINETLSNENKLGKWLWNSGKLKNNYNIIWDTQKINTFPDKCKLDNDKSIIVVNEEGYYEIILGFYGNNKKPNIQILVDNEVVISNASKNINNNSVNQICSNTIYSGFMKTNKNTFANGTFRNVTGLTIIDFIFLKNNSKLCVFYNGDIGKGFLCLKKI